MNLNFISRNIALAILGMSALHINPAMAQTQDTTTYGYDAQGNRTSITDPLGKTTTFGYDALNRVTRVDWVDATKRATPVVSSRYIYDQGINGIGRMTGIIDESGHTEFSYDLRGRMLGKVQTVVTGSEQKSFSMSQTFGKSGSATGSMTSHGDTPVDIALKKDLMTLREF